MSKSSVMGGDNDDGKIKLVSLWSSPFVTRVRLALELKGLEYEIVEEDEDIYARKSQLLLESNPVYKKVPVLIHNGKAICESMVIVQYLDEVWPEDGTRPGILPKDGYSRAMARFWVDFAENKIFQAGGRCLSATGKERAKAEAEFFQNCDILEELLSKNEEGPFFGGNKMGYVDIALSTLAHSIPIYVEIEGFRFPDEKQCPRLHEWMQAVCNCPAAKAVFPDPEKLKDYLKVSIPRSKARKAAATQK